MTAQQKQHLKEGLKAIERVAEITRELKLLQEEGEKRARLQILILRGTANTLADGDPQRTKRILDHLIAAWLVARRL
jgi:hypothetical protein